MDDDHNQTAVDALMLPEGRQTRSFHMMTHVYGSQWGNILIKTRIVELVLVGVSRHAGVAWVGVAVLRYSSRSLRHRRQLIPYTGGARIIFRSFVYYPLLFAGCPAT